MIKIALISGDSSTTGVPSHVATLAKGLDKKKFEVLVICPPGPLVATLKKLKIPCKEIKMRGVFDRTGNHEIRRELINFSPDIAHFHGMRAGWLGRLAARKLKKVRKIYSEHQWVEELNLSNPAYQEIQLQALKFLDRWTDKTIAVSKPVSDFLSRRGFDKKKIIIVPNGIDDEFFKTKPIEKPDCLPQIIGTVASLNEVKNYRNIILAMAKIKQTNNDLNFKYQIIGEGPQRKNLENLVERKKLGETVHFLGRVPSTAERMRHFGVYLNASKSETFGLAVVEAMAMGLPVVVSKIPALEYVVADAGLYLNPKDTDDIGRKIVEILINKDLREKLSAKGKQRARGEFSSEKMVKRISEIYIELIKKSAR
ncbi:MAG: Alpha-monoglucosyldiacylglycerol synthase [candidate division WS2 bacterium ADurb.Bin280]|uniref:Alpha-monoglucosyldiacylglycerol synthase n=1 Tax=candidate division WS2 bacterium ADurb.Bin280 TaxID=1852829 RepID=A0A1V5SG55_9BACT|nr:MAG: Alpha-monoglucosyldiacylglycerol synthase [candidate division WS2 bacterium ADurb.Bin280]